MCVRVCLFVSNRNHRNNDDMNRDRRDCTDELLTAEADTLVQGISETVSVLARGVTTWRTWGQKNKTWDYHDDVLDSVRGLHGPSLHCMREPGRQWWRLCVFVLDFVTGSVHLPCQTEGGYRSFLLKEGVEAGGIDLQQGGGEEK